MQNWPEGGRRAGGHWHRRRTRVRGPWREARGTLTCPFGGTLAVVSVDAVHAGSPILAAVLRTVVDVNLAVGPVEA